MQTHARLSDAEARRKAVGWLDRVGIPAAAQRIDAYPHEFSGGQRQRVVIALALCAEPELVIADEPTTALDVSVQAQIITLLKDLTRDHGTAVMLVTHDMGVIAETADRVAVMYAGRIAEIGPVRAVIRHPAHPYTEGLMASIPSMEHRVERLRQIDGAMPRLDAIPSGCRFHPRCPRVFGRCLTKQPDLLTAGRRGPPAGCTRMAEPAMLEAVGDLARLRCLAPVRCNGCSRGKAGDSCARWTTCRSPSRAARPSRWWASPAAANPPSPAWRSGCTRPAAATSGSRARRCPPRARSRRLRRRMNMIFQDPYASLNPRWRVGDIIAEPIRAFGWRRGRTRCGAGWARCWPRSG